MSGWSSNFFDIGESDNEKFIFRAYNYNINVKVIEKYSIRKLTLKSEFNILCLWTYVNIKLYYYII